MIVFKTLFQIIQKNKVATLLYFGIFAALIIFFAASANDDDKTDFTQIDVPVAIIDRDGGKIGPALEKYLSQDYTLVSLPDEKERFQDELFYRNVDYILIIPEGYESSLLSGEKNVSLEHIKVPDSIYGDYANMQVDQFLRTFSAYTGADFTMDESIENSINDLKKETSVKTAEEEIVKTPFIYYFFQYLAYVLLSAMISTLCPTFIAFYKKNLVRRTEISALHLRSRNAQLIAGAAAASLAIWIAFLIMAAILCKKDFFSQTGLYLVINSAAMLLVSASAAFLIGFLAKNSDAVDAISNTVGLGTAFLCGVFVPQEMLSGVVLTLAKFLPVYWYVRSAKLITENEIITSRIFSQITQGILIQVGFAAAIFSITLALTRYRKLHPSD